jgi:multiple sugar transport system permease protein
MLDSIQQFDIIYAMTQGGPGDTLMVFQILAYLEAFTFTSIGRSAAMMMVLWLITNILSTLFMKQWMRLRERARGLA